ncbi:hypothetical protein FAY30_24595 [Bacillus sp. S3]|uniref:hypothetical protein n=1 Tax=Bacillus sp. S3 TaxID=486398 RepID=UPI00118AAD2D|nr:hypothetical protein [Bacillus sp. S3]QCJ44805.1 hypothetical protein FAY30_24595 [Bacillus sp. S3]
MRKINSIIVLGKQVDSRDSPITSKPSFHDALQLTHQSPTSSKDSSYQSFPLEDGTHISLHYSDYTFEASLENRTISISKDGGTLTEEEAYEELSHFIMKEGTKVSFLALPPHRKTRPRKRKNERVLEERKKLEEELGEE